MPTAFAFRLALARAQHAEPNGATDRSYEEPIAPGFAETLFAEALRSGYGFEAGPPFTQWCQREAHYALEISRRIKRTKARGLHGLQVSRGCPYPADETDQQLAWRVFTQ